MNELYKEFLEDLKIIGIYDEKFISFLEGKVHRFPIFKLELGWGVFPKLDREGKIIDFRMLVPNITNEKTLLINIHEYVHAYDWYQMLNKFDDLTKDAEFEKRARNAERLVLKIRQKRNNNHDNILN